MEKKNYLSQGFGNSDGYTQVMPGGGGSGIAYTFRTPEENRGEGYINFAAQGEYVEGILHALFINDGPNGKIYNYSIWVTGSNIPVSVKKSKDNPRPQNIPLEMNKSYSFSATKILVERLDPLPIPSAVRIIYDGRHVKNYKLWKVFQRPLTQEEHIYFESETAGDLTFGKLKEIKLSYGSHAGAPAPLHNPPQPPSNTAYGIQGASYGTGGYAPTVPVYGQQTGSQAPNGSTQVGGGQPQQFQQPGAMPPPATGFQQPAAPASASAFQQPVAPATAPAFQQPGAMPPPTPGFKQPGSMPPPAQAMQGMPLPPLPVNQATPLAGVNTEEDDLPF